MSNLPSVLNVCFSNSWGGLEMSSAKMARLFREAGHPSFAVCRTNSPIASALAELKLDHRSFAPRKYVSPGVTLAIRRLVVERRVRAIFLHALKDLWLVAPALMGLPDVRLIGFARMFIRNVSKKDFAHACLYRRVDRLIALSHRQATELLKCLPIRKDQLTVIPNGVDTTRFARRTRREDLRAGWGFTPEHVVFGLIGRFDLQKGSLEFVEAAARVIRNHPRARFVMVGENTKSEGEFDRLVRRRIAELNLERTLTLADFSRDVPAVMNALDCFVLPSYEENFGNVLLEALSSGLPTIGTDAGGTPEILSGGEVGLLCQPKSASSLAEAMVRLLESPARAADLGHRARAKAEREYEMGRVFSMIAAQIR